MAANTPHIYKSKSGNWNMSFHHPICREGSVGKKIHRSLKVTDESEAFARRDQMKELLRIADETPSLLPTRSNAIANHNYARVVVDAFFDCMTPEPVDYLALRNKVMPLPPRVGAKGGVPHVLVVGATGVGKSRLLQHLLQTTRQNFPMRGAGRTTVSDTEVIVDDGDFSAVITFFAENEMRQIVRENILEACAFADKDKSDKAKIASKLLVDSDKRFRLNFVLGAWGQKSDSMSDDDDFDADGEDVEFETETSSAASAWPKLEHCVDQVVSMAERARENSSAEAHSDEERQAADEYWLQHIDHDQLDVLTEEILGEIERKLCIATGQSSWPVIHRIADTADKTDFFAKFRPFYQNHRTLFGALVTPLVQGIRVRGRFSPPVWVGGKSSPWVLLDGQGVGHEQGTSTKINQTVPPELTKKFSDADLILLVDKAMPAMTGDSPILLQNLIARGFLERLALVFTHFEAVNAPDLDAAGRRAKVLEGLSSAIQSIDSLPKTQKVLLEGTAESKAYYLARLDAREVTHKPTQAELRRLCDRFNDTVGEQEVQPIRPSYNEYQIAAVVRREIEAYRHDWSATELAGFNYKIIEALTNWIGNAYADGYPKKRLYPGQDLSRRLVSAISIELENPREWQPGPPDSTEEESQILNAIRNLVGNGIDAYCRDAVVRDPRTVAWLPAYQNIGGRGTLMRRARTVARILEDNAQLPDEGVGRFTKDIWRIVQEATVAVCAPEDEQDTKRAVAGR
jgi:hypothetical protein